MAIRKAIRKTKMQSWKNKPDDTLLELIEQGSHHAFKVLVERYSMRFFRLAFRYVVQKEAAEDIVQRAFLKIWEKPELWNPAKGVKFTTWFSRVVINLGLDMQKKRTPLLLAEQIEAVDDDNSQEDKLIDAQQKVQIEYAIRSLPVRQQTALNLCFYEEMSNADAAQVMEVSIGAIESLLVRAKSNLRSKLEYDKKRQIA